MRTETSTGHGSAAVRKVLEAELDEARSRGTDHPRIVDVGGGSGGWAVPFAAAGCLVTVVEPNPDALATLRRRATEEGVADRITVVADDSDSLPAHVASGSADLVLAHGLLEVVDDPGAVVRALATTVVPGGAVSLLVANRIAAALHRALAGRLSEASRLLAEPDGVLGGEAETVRRRFDTAAIETLLRTAELEPTQLQGDGVVADVVHLPESQPESAVVSWQHDLGEFESQAAVLRPLRDIASRLHALARRPA